MSSIIQSGFQVVWDSMINNNSNSPALHSFNASLPSDINETVFTSPPHSYLRRCSRALGRMRLFITDPSRGVYPPLTAGLQSHAVTVFIQMLDKVVPKSLSTVPPDTRL